MQSFHRSRGRIFFEALCALAISASLVGAWMQTGASALLAAAAVSALFGLAHAVQPTGRRTAVVVDPQVVAFAPEDQDELLDRLGAVEPEPDHEPASIDQPAEEVDADDPAPLEEAYHAPIERLFEPEPFPVHQRTVFGRKTDKPVPVAVAAAPPKRRSRKKSTA